MSGGTVPAGYTFRRMLAETGAHEIWEVEDERGRRLELKRLREGAGEDQWVRLRHEGALLSRIPPHPALVRLYDLRSDPPALVLELASGALDERLREGLSLPEALSLFRPVAQAVAHLHAHGVVHRDVKPSNVLLRPDGVRLADLGVAAPTGSEGALPGWEEEGVGTGPYAAPEQRSGRHAIGPAADVYSLGVLLHELVVGRPPGDDAAPEIPRWLMGPLTAALSDDPSARPSALDLLRSLPDDRSPGAGMIALLCAAIGVMLLLLWRLFLLG